jgi:hypothetical protein
MLADILRKKIENEKHNFNHSNCNIV